MLPVNCGSHKDYQDFVVKNLRKYYPNPGCLARSTWDIIERFWHLDLSSVDLSLADKYSRFGPAPRTPSCMLRSYLLSIEFGLSEFLTSFPHSGHLFVVIVFFMLSSYFLQVFIFNHPYQDYPDNVPALILARTLPSLVSRSFSDID